MGTEVKDFGLSAGAGVNATTGWFPEGQLPSTVNNAAREVMAAVRRLSDDICGANTGTFTAQTYTVPTAQDVTALARGHLFTWIAEKTNTGTALAVINGLSAVPIKVGPNHLVSGQIISGQAVSTVFDGTSLQLLNSLPLPVYSKGNSGYYTLPGGVLVNWIRLAFSGASGPSSGSWATAFSGTPYVAVTGHNFGDSSVWISTLNSTTVAATAGVTVTGTCYVLAIGPA